MKVALMQPYFLPYLGYYQLIKAVDLFVIYDDVQFIKNGWVNRNRILLNGKPHYITLPVMQGHLSDQIRERHFSDVGPASEKILRQLESAYKRAPFFGRTFPLVEELLNTRETRIGDYLFHQLKALAGHLGISTMITRSSALPKSVVECSGQERVIQICRTTGARTYLNAIGGASIYDDAAFNAEGLELRFLRTLPYSYPQFGAAFEPHLSIIDVLMFNDVETASRLLTGYECIPWDKVSANQADNLESAL